MLASRHHQSLLEYRRARYLKLALCLVVLATVAYLWIDPTPRYPKHYGGTWLGYTLGTIAALLMLWLMLLGIRKRRYGSRLGTVQGWTSAHVYLGGAVLVVATLHAGFELGWNVHTLAWVLVLAVSASGVYGVLVYLRYPALVTANLGDDTLDTLVLKVGEIDRECEALAMNLPDEVNALVMRARQSRVGGGLLRELRGERVRCPTREACARLPGALAPKLSTEQVRLGERLLAAMVRKRELLARARRDLQLRAAMRVWLLLHVPLSFGAIAALIAHVVSVFYFW